MGKLIFTMTAKPWMGKILCALSDEWRNLPIPMTANYGIYIYIYREKIWPLSLFMHISGMKSTIDSNISAELVLKIILFFFCNIGMILNICSADKSSTLYAGSAFFLARDIFDREWQHRSTNRCSNLVILPEVVTTQKAFWQGSGKEKLLIP